MIAYLKAFGAKHNLETKVDEAGNVLIKKPATPGKENLQTVVLQSHIDMVCEKNNDVQHDFLTDPIETEIDGEWLKAKGTTLGADNGIGVATELAILADDSIEHGPLECLFTVDEETGLTGAFALQEGFMSGDILLNLDSEDEGEIFFEILPEQGRALHGHYFCNRCVHLCFCVDVYRIGRCLRLVLRGEYYFVAAVDTPSDTAVCDRCFVPAVGPLVCRVDVEHSGNSGLRKQLETPRF